MNQEELIDKYFENNLSEAELVTFNELLIGDTNFAKEVEFRKNLQAATHLAERALLKNKLKQFEPAKSKVVKMNKRGVWFAAAVFVLVIASTIWILFQKPDAQQLYALYYEPYPNVVAPVTRSEAKIDSTIQYAFLMYEAGKYENAALIFQKIYANTKAPFALVYFGICNIQVEQTTTAITALKEAITTNNDYTVIAKWYLAMAYLKNDEPKLALPLVQEVAEAEHPLKPVAEKLYEKLKVYE
jgi:tetratricopeptide (TPR) repeat protein